MNEIAKSTVYGASLDNDFVVRHHRADCKDQRNTLRKSKYVQSDIGTAFNSVKQDLENGFYVLFSGTPCQCDGLRAYLELKNINCDKLCICDIICNGVPSPLIFKDYLDWLNTRSNKKVIAFEFRDKNRFSWGECIEKVDYGKKCKYQDWYGNIFGDFYAHRPSCFNCKYANLKHTSDITLGDFWGLEKIHPEVIDENGVSLVIVHTSKGAEYFNKMAEYVNYWGSIDSKYVLQPRLQSSPAKPDAYDSFWKDYKQNGFDYVLRKYSYNTVTFYNNIKKRSYLILRKIYRFFFPRKKRES